MFFLISCLCLSSISDFGRSETLTLSNLSNVGCIGLLAQEHKDRVMIQKSLIRVVEPKEQEVDRIDRQHNAKNRGEAIQMPPLHMTLIKVHREYANLKTNRAAKDMEEACKRAMVAADRLHDQFSRAQADNTGLSGKLRQAKEKLKEAEDQLQTYQLTDMAQVLDLQLRTIVGN